MNSYLNIYIEYLRNNFKFLNEIHKIVSYGFLNNFIFM